MKALLLAAGAGQRLGSITDMTPKPMLEVSGSPILEHNIRLLAHYGIRDLIMNLHHLPETISDYFGDGSKWDVNIQYSYEPELLGTAGAAKKFENFFDETFMVFYGDNLNTCNLDKLQATHHEKAGAGVIALFHREDTQNSGIAQIDSDQRIQRFVEKPTSDQDFSKWVNAGILIFEPEILELVPEGVASDFSREIIPAALEKGMPIYGYTMTEDLWWVDTPADLNRVQQLKIKKGW
jgi:mannose-1-phosphate guanylyltransferase